MNVHEAWSRLGRGLRTESRVVQRFRFMLWPAAAVVAVILIIRQATNAKDLADLLRAVASLGWPLVVVLGMHWFRAEIRSLLGRIRKGKLLGNEFELDALESKAVQAEEKAEEKAQAVGQIELRGEGRIEASATVVLPDQTIQATGAVRSASADDAIGEVLNEASRSPPLGLMLLSSKLERAAQDLAADAGIADGRQRPLRFLVESLVRSEILPREVGDALVIFSRVRNRVVHGHDASEEEIIRAIDSGIKLLRTVLTARSTITVIRHSDVPLFSDAKATVPVANATGVIIDIGGGSERAIVPTRQHFYRGMRVTLAWGMDTKWGDTWYRDPETGEIKKAWQEAAEFIGRPVGGQITLDISP
jgi:hypothetical protein